LNDLRRQLQITSKSSTSCIEYLQNIRKIVDELSFIGSPVSEDDLTLAVLSDLGPDYSSFYVAVTTVSRFNPISFADLHRLFISHEDLLQSQYTVVAALTPSHAAFLNHPTNPSIFSSKPSHFIQSYNSKNYPQHAQYNPNPPLLSTPSYTHISRHNLSNSRAPFIPNQGIQPPKKLPNFFLSNIL
jgi:gag-polypeptide of LTR copia-type